MLKWASLFSAGYDWYLKLLSVAGYDDMMKAAIGGLPGNGVILDIGTGTGLAAEFAGGSHPHSTIVGLDLSLCFLRRARRRTSSPCLVQGSGISLPFAGATVHDAMAFGLLCHITDPAALITEIHRVLRPAGRLVLWTRASDFWGHALKLVFPVFARGASFSVYTNAQLLDLLEGGGFQDIHVTRQACGLLARATKPEPKESRRPC